MRADAGSPTAARGIAVVAPDEAETGEAVIAGTPSAREGPDVTLQIGPPGHSPASLNSRRGIFAKRNLARA